MAFLNSILAFLGMAENIPDAIAGGVAAPGSMWHVLILKSFAFVTDYGWRIVVFTVLLKLVLSPLDFYQRYKMHKNQKITERLKPTMEKIQKQYGNDKQAFSQKQMELNRKEGYSYFSACLPMILTMVIFITLWLSMQTIARYMTFKEYITMYDEYQYVTAQLSSSETEGADSAIAEKIGQEVVYEMYYRGVDDGFISEIEKKIEQWREEDDLNAARAESEGTDYRRIVPDGFALPEDFTLLREGVTHIEKTQASFLWVKNIWAPDVPWGNQAILSWSAFESGVGDYKNATTSGLSSELHMPAYNQVMYERVMGKLLNDPTESRTNGYLVLPILVVVLSLCSQLLSMFQQKRAGQVNAKGGMATSMKVMMVIMPIMMAVFAVQYASIFALYMTVNSATTLFFNFTFTGIIKLIDKSRRNRKHGIKTGSTRAVATVGNNSAIIHYVKGANPNAGAKVTVTPSDVTESDAVKDKRSKKTKAAQQQTRSTVQGGRPDPNDLMNMDMTSKSNKKK